MPQTVVGLFHHLAEARSAQEQLMQGGFTPAMIDVSPGTLAPATSDDKEKNSRGEPDGAVTHFFKNLFNHEPDATRYAGVAGYSEAVVTVHASSEDQARRAAEILDNAGSIDVDADAARHGAADEASDAGSVKVIEENLQVGKRTVDSGGARVRSRIVEREVSEDVRLRQERVLVHRRSVDRVANAEDLAAFREGQIEVVEHAEVPVVTKEARVVEEVSVTKEESERTETVRDTVRGTEVEVEELDPSKPRR